MNKIRLIPLLLALLTLLPSCSKNDDEPDCKLAISVSVPEYRKIESSLVRIYPKQADGFWNHTETSDFSKNEWVWSGILEKVSPIAQTSFYKSFETIEGLAPGDYYVAIRTTTTGYPIYYGYCKLKVDSQYEGIHFDFSNDERGTWIEFKQNEN